MSIYFRDLEHFFRGYHPVQEEIDLEKTENGYEMKRARADAYGRARITNLEGCSSIELYHCGYQLSRKIRSWSCERKSEIEIDLNIPSVVLIYSYFCLKIVGNGNPQVKVERWVLDQEEHQKIMIDMKKQIPMKIGDSELWTV